MLLAISQAGHDKGRLYVILKEDDEYTYLCDGKYRSLDNPKKKRKKHVQVIKEIPTNVAELIKDGQLLNNEGIKRAIKLYHER
ncbi:KOW domain-containing RNA-binding protein [Anaerosacchariphilus polymeriproducens]|uniref:50S ribosomal protein L14 n=1 Tax=Anaerosacchariphilus polymeriproducens TaxID=1812858 RepID=A0A371AQB9_9FIRM|nr:KOW domain-containing RNA-binding protein [Anaerosacchariphilus polymeriproducens]RDU21773.1 50S ribosomal protein L14 [Anaerosacchariphilus polymeriproducens]